MERMSEEEFINNVEGHITSLKNLDNKALKILVGKLEEENKELKEHNENLIRADKKKSDHIDELEEENKKLKKECEENDYLVEDNARWMKECEEKTMEIKKLKDKIKHLEFDIEAWKGLKAVWEKKEQELQRENDKLKIHIEAKDKAYMGLLTDYNYLKARIKKMEKSYLKFHDDLKKLDDKLDNDIMNR